MHVTYRQAHVAPASCFMHIQPALLRIMPLCGSGLCCAHTHTVCSTPSACRTLPHTRTFYSFPVDWPKHVIIMSLTHAMRDPLSPNLCAGCCTHVRARLDICLSINVIPRCWGGWSEPRGCLLGTWRKGCRQLLFLKGSDHHLHFLTCWRAINPWVQWVFEGAFCHLNQFYNNMRLNLKQTCKCGGQPHLSF